jgi:GTP-binding protein HflX
MREEQIQEALVKVLLVGVDVGEEPDFERSMEELASLAEAAEKEVAGQIIQRLDHINKALYIGTGGAQAGGGMRSAGDRI